MDIQNIKELLNSRSLKATPHRINLLQEMQAYQSAMPYPEIQKVMTAMDRVTLYRTLETLLQQGVIHQAYQEEQTVYYALCGHQCTKDQHQHDHVHFRCTNCEAVTCLELSTSIQLSLPKHVIHKISIQLEGICEGCTTLSK